MKNKLRIFFSIWVLFLLSACTASVQHPLNGTRHLPVVNEPALIGRSQEDIRATFGTPNAVRTEEPNQIWTYKKDSCIIFMYMEKEEVVFAEGRGNCKAFNNSLEVKG